MQLNTDSLKTKYKNFIGDTDIDVVFIAILIGGLGFLGALWSLLSMILQGFFESSGDHVLWLVLSGGFIGIAYALLTRDGNLGLWAQGWIFFRSIVYCTAIIGFGPLFVGGALLLGHEIFIEVFDWLVGLSGVEFFAIVILAAAVIAIVYLWQLALLVLVIVLLVWFIKWLWVTLPV